MIYFLITLKKLSPNVKIKQSVFQLDLAAEKFSELLHNASI